MKTYFFITIVISTMLLPICLGQYKKPEDLKTTCSYLAQKNNRYINSDHDTSQRCIFCQYKYNNTADKVYGGCASCPDQNGLCTSCVEGFILYEGKCVACGDSIKTCQIANTEFKKDKIIQQVLSDITNSSTMSVQEKNLAQMDVHKKYLALRADKCTQTTESGIVLELGHMCRKFENCEKIEKTSSSVSCSKCKVGFFFDQEFKCISQCNANIVKFSDKYFYDSQETCSECTYNGICKKCPKGTVEIQANNESAKSAVATSNNQSLMICQKCMDNCDSCIASDAYSNKIKCSSCKLGYYYNSQSNTCDECTIDQHFVKVPSNSQKQGINIVCSGTSFEQINWSSSKVTQTDVLNQTYSYSIKTSDKKAYICGEGATDCEFKGGEIKDTECLYGFALKDNKCIECSKLVDNSVLCEFNEKMNDYIPTLCKIGNQFDIPYTDSYILQITISSIEKYNSNEVPSPKTWCQKNTNGCKIMVPINQKKDLNLSDEVYQGGCSDCFTDEDIPSQYRKTSKQDFFKVEDNQIHKCLRCTDIPNAIECTLNGKQLVPKTCASSYYLDSNDKSCKKCDSSCNECSTNATTCTVCPTNKYLTSQNTCAYLETESISKLQNCLNQKQVNNQQSCQVCEENYELVAKSDNIYICQAKPIPFCEEMVGTECKRCIQKSEGVKQYYLKDNKCVAIPTGCANYSNGNCTTCQYSYKPVIINEVQVCIPCYQEYKDLQSYIQYDCPGKVKSSSLEDDTGVDVKSKTNSVKLAFTTIALILLALF